MVKVVLLDGQFCTDILECNSKQCETNIKFTNLMCVHSYIIHVYVCIMHHLGLQSVLKPLVQDDIKEGLGNKRLEINSQGTDSLSLVPS